ncbi:MAG: hypothetical protein JWN07_775 [Hyphomicrobiales bacterium]|nr:hypothetical protein [Hyphomicrobiales bacterium]
MRALLAFLVIALAWANAASAQMPGAPGNVKLNEICETRGRPGCPVHLSIEGAITAETARSFASLLELEQKRVGAWLRPVVSIQSTGGDLQAAMAIGREIRKRTGTIQSAGPCHSACVFAAMGGVERKLAGIGLHRPYFAYSDTNVFAEADARYKRMLRLIVDYLFEMNISDDVLRVMVAVPPGEMRVLSAPDARRIGLNGVDPAYDEFRTGQEAAQYGISSFELRRRQAALEQQCGREDDMRSLADMHKRETCRTSMRERLLWGLDEETYARLNRSTQDRCRMLAPDSPERRQCVRRVADALRGDTRE